VFIYVDADSCPVPARELVLRTAKRTGIAAYFAANRPIPGIGGADKTAVMLLCPEGEGAADDAIAEKAGPGDLAVTRDVPLAARLVEKGVTVLDDRGRVFTRDAIREKLSLRDFTVDLANSGLDYERTANYGPRDKKAFADALDRLITKMLAR
jgi:uncharacterized protein YaiI (UPF0178 family)